MPIIFTKKHLENITKDSEIATGSFSNSLDYYQSIIDNISNIETIEVELVDNDLELAITSFSEISIDKTIYIYIKKKVKSFYDEIKDSLDSYINSHLYIEKKEIFAKAKCKKSFDTQAFGAIEKDECVCLESKNYDFQLDESFSEALIRIIDEKGLTDPEVYKMANMDRKLFNHIKNDKDYHARKETCIALCIALKLDLKQSNDLLEKAGYILSRSSYFDVVIQYCIEHQIYNINDINEILFANDQKLLG